MSELELTTTADKFNQAFLKAPDRLEKNIGRAIQRSIREMGRSAREYAPKAFSQLVNSIRDQMTGPVEGIVVPGTDYAEAVERGTGIYGPVGVASGKLPPVDNILDWVKVAGVVPQKPGLSQEDLAWLIARSIAVSGTKAQPYMKPAFDDNAAKAEQRINDAIDKTIAEASG